MKRGGLERAEGILFTDEYQLTMAQLYFCKGLHEREVQFEYFFRTYPDYGAHKAGYCIFAGVDFLLDWMQKARFGKADIEILKSQKTDRGRRLFSDDFLRWLSKEGHFGNVSVRAVAEGRVVHPNVPLVIVRGPFAMAQILESSLLNHLNYETLVATKASRIREAGCRSTLIEFGMRRAQGRGACEGTRAALIGGADFSSNVGMSHLLGYPPKGTHAHSMVQAFMALGEGELGAFRAWADVYPDNCIFLVDTRNTLESGIPNAVRVFKELKRKGHKPLGIRLDSGDLAYLSIQAHKMLNEAGFPEARIVLSNQLDEMVISQIIQQIRKEAHDHGIDADHLVGRLVYGVGARLLTSEGCSALDGVYKLTAIEDKKKWVPSIKLSETPSKTINPGPKCVWRLYDREQKAIGDLIGTGDEDPSSWDTLMLRHPVEPHAFRRLERRELSKIEPLLIEVLRKGRRLRPGSSIEEARKLREKDLDRLHEGVKRLINPHIYHVSLTEGLWKLKEGLINGRTS